MRVVVALLGILALGWPVAAQYVDEEELEDQRRQDERYYRRYVERTDEQTDEPPADEEALARAFLERADDLIRDRNYRSERADHALLQTDDPRLDLRAVSRLLESFRDFFERFWAGRIELRPYDEPSRVFLFYSYYKYNQLVGGDWRRSVVRPKGHYGDLFDAIVLHTDSDRPGGLANTIVHEAAHQLIDRRLYGASGPSPWVSEGLATYFGETHMDADGRFVAGAIGGKRLALLRDGRKGASDARPRLRALRKALKQAESGESSIVGQVIGADPSRFYSGDVLESYAVSWLLVHWLLHGDDGAHADAFLRYLGLEAAGAGGATALLDALGATEAEIDAALLRHVERVRVE